MSIRIFVFIVLASLAALTGCNSKATGPAKTPITEVMYVLPSEREILEYEEFTGRTDSLERVDLRARVSGYLEKIHFKDGDNVHKDDLLFTIDDRSYKAQAERAAAAVAQMKARQARLKRQADRAEQLIQTKAMSQEQYEATLYDAKESVAAVSAAEADLEVAKLYVDFTKITSPITGRISRRLVDVGNLVKADDTLLATIMATDTLYVYFDVDERTVLRLSRLRTAGQASGDKLEVQIALADETDFPHRGIVDFKDITIEQGSGTLRYRAKIDNSTHFLSPGMFVRIRYPIGEKHRSLLVPEEALASDQGQRYLYVIGEDDKVQYRRVETGIMENGQRVIRNGLKPDERVVVTGLQRIRPQMQVAPLLFGETAPKTAVRVAAEK